MTLEGKGQGNLKQSYTKLVNSNFQAKAAAAAAEAAAKESKPKERVATPDSLAQELPTPDEDSNPRGSIIEERKVSVKECKCSFLLGATFQLEDGSERHNKVCAVLWGDIIRTLGGGIPILL